MLPRVKWAWPTLLLALTITACSAETRYRVKTIFFTGVPAPGQEQVASTAAETPAQHRAALIAREEQRKKALQQPRFFTHGPYGAGGCNLCHSSSNAGRLRRGAGSGGMSSAVGGIGSMFVLPQSELCASCHAEKSRAQAAARGLWLHGPAASGWCTECHNPHSSQRRFMLQAEGSKLCTRCHLLSDIRRAPVHQQDPLGGCIACHNPHLGASRMLLKTEFDESRQFR